MSFISHRHEIAKLEVTYKFLYMLRDLGIKNANLEAEEVWTAYMFLISQVMVGESV